MHIRFTIVLTIAFCANLSLYAKGVKKADKPNIIVIFMDDMGYSDLGCFGAEGFSTPNIDKMADEGLRLSDFYSAAAVCTPSRAALLTGCYPQRVGNLPVLFPDRNGKKSVKGLNPKEITIADMLRKNGYKTAIVGKWHLGDKETFLPLQQGFDEYFGLPYSNDMSKGRSGMPPLPLIEGNKVIEELPDQRYLTKRYTERAIQFISKNKKEPFFLYLAHTMPHTPLFASENFKGKTKRGLYGDVLEELDWGVGEVMQALKDNKIDKNTLVILTSDNGPWLTENKNGGSALPLRDGKMTFYDGGLRVPCIMHWPGKIDAGRKSAEIVSTIDLLPTFAAITVAKLPKDKIDGKNLSSFLLKNQSSPRTHLFYNTSVVRKGKWKLLLPGTYSEIHKNEEGKNKKIEVKYNEIRLYNMETDIAEKNNVAGEYPKIVKELKQMVSNHKKDMAKNGRPCGLLNE